MKPSSRPGVAARAAAADLLEQVIDERVGLDTLTDPKRGRPAFLKLEARDRGLARAIVATALRRRGTIERGLARFLDRKLPGGARHLVHTLHVAAAQVLFMQAADHAAIDIAVGEAKRDPRSKRFAPLVNAVLRRVSENAEEIAALQPDPKDVPPWLWKRWRQDFGKERALGIVASLREEPPLDLTLKHIDVEKPEGSALANGTWRIAAGIDKRVPDLPGYEAGGWWVQDVAATLPVDLLGDVKGLRVLDMCAAPGGKTAQLAARGAQVTALDRAAPRLERLRENLSRLGLDAETVEADALEYAPSDPFDAVLLDAPCSSLGTLRRHPDVVWTKTAEDVAALADLQKSLLAQTLDLVKPGGLVVFANCSVMKAEGEDLWQTFRIRGDVVEQPVEPADVFGLDAVTGQGALRTLPFMAPFTSMSNSEAGGMDGFFAARFRKAA